MPLARAKFDKEEAIGIMVKSKGERNICKEFGCGRELTIREQLFGNYCIHHSIKTEPGG